MSALAYTIATASPHSLLLAGFVVGVLTLSVISLLGDAYRARRHG